MKNTMTPEFVYFGQGWKNESRRSPKSIYINQTKNNDKFTVRDPGINPKLKRNWLGGLESVKSPEITTFPYFT